MTASGFVSERPCYSAQELVGIYGLAERPLRADGHGHVELIWSEYVEAHCASLPRYANTTPRSLPHGARL